MLDLADGVGAASLAQAREEVLIAEGSDWFWWYGDDHSSDHDAAFDDLFRCHLRNVYLALGEPPPHDLWISNVTTSPTAAPTAPWISLTPTIDGDDTSYFEWLGAGWFDARAAVGAMHQVSGTGPRMQGFRYGYGEGALWLSVVIDGDGGLADGYLTMSFPEAPNPFAVSVSSDGRLSGTAQACSAASGRTAEVRIPLAAIGAVSAVKIPLAIAHATTLTGVPSQWHIELHGPAAITPRPWRA